MRQLQPQGADVASSDKRDKASNICACQYQQHAGMPTTDADCTAAGCGAALKMHKPLAAVQLQFSTLLDERGISTLVPRGPAAFSTGTGIYVSMQARL